MDLHCTALVDGNFESAGSGHGEHLR